MTPDADALAEFVDRLNDALGITQEEAEEFCKKWDEMKQKRKEEKE